MVESSYKVERTGERANVSLLSRAWVLGEMMSPWKI